MVKDPGLIGSGNGLLSRRLARHYHRGCGVSRPCSGWARVGPPRSGHQRAGEAEARPGGIGGGALCLLSCLNFARNSGGGRPPARAATVAWVCLRSKEPFGVL
jgi:hypothetical protein